MKKQMPHAFLFFLSTQDEEFNEMIHSDERINFLYGHFFDEEIVNETLATALEQLLVCVERAETEPLWAPSSWVQ